MENEFLSFWKQFQYVFHTEIEFLANLIFLFTFFDNAYYDFIEIFKFKQLILCIFNCLIFNHFQILAYFACLCLFWQP